MEALMIRLMAAVLDGVGIGLLAEASLKGLVLLLAAAAILRVSSGMSAAERHLVWVLSLGSLLVLPLLTRALPRWDIAMSAPATLVTAAEPTWSGATPLEVISSSGSIVVRPAMQGSAPAMLSWRTAVLVVWASGAAWLLALLALALGRAAWMTLRARPLREGPCADAVALLARRLGLRRPPKLIEAAGSAMPMTWGVFRPVILIPRGAERWPAARVEAVLVHELAHVRRWDLLTQVVMQVACALYWFNPLVWVALRRLRLESEKACDDLVLKAGVRPSAYADHLIAFARAIRGDRGLALASSSIAEPSQLPSRIRALLEEERDRRGVSARMLSFTILVVGALSAAVAAAAPASAARSDPASLPAAAAPLARATVAGAAAVAPSTTRRAVGAAVATRANPSAASARAATPADTTRPVILNLAQVNGLLERSYPPGLRKEGVSGTALLELRIDTQGRVVDARVISATERAFGEAASRSLAAARFAPARAQGRAVSARIQWPVAFNAFTSLTRAERAESAVAAVSALSDAQGRFAEAQSRIAVSQSRIRETQLMLRRALEARGVAAGVVAEAETVAELTALLRQSAEGAARARRVSDGPVRAALLRHHPNLQSLGADEYVWFLATPGGEVRATGIATRRQPGVLTWAEVTALLEAQAPGTRIVSMQMSSVSAVPAGGTLDVAWLVEGEPEP